MTEIIESEFDLLSLTEKEAFLIRQGKFVSRREAEGMAIFLYSIKNRFAEVSYYLRSHEIIRAFLLPGTFFLN